MSSMRLVLAALLILLCPGAIALHAESNADDTPGALALWYDKPAAFNILQNDFQVKYRTLLNTALPVGNGRMGALIKGGVAKEFLPLNEDSLWTGGLDPSGEIAKMGSYQPLVNLVIDLPGHEPFTNYRRSLGRP
jgi:hypothetical protein